MFYIDSSGITEIENNWTYSKWYCLRKLKINLLQYVTKEGQVIRKNGWIS